MRDHFRWLCSRLFGWRYVTLIDFDSAVNVRRVEFMGSKPFARRVAFDIGNVVLLDGRKVTGVSYVTSWEPYEPLGEKRWPVPA